MRTIGPNASRLPGITNWPRNVFAGNNVQHTIPARRLGSYFEVNFLKPFQVMLGRLDQVWITSAGIMGSDPITGNLEGGGFCQTLHI